MKCMNAFIKINHKFRPVYQCPYNKQDIYVPVPTYLQT